MKPTKIGIDALGAAFFTKEALRASEVGDSIGVMPETFTGTAGAGWKAVERFGASKKFFEIVVHLTPFDSTHNYPVTKCRKLLRANATRMEDYANRYPDTIWLCSPFCEHNHPKSVMEPLYHELRELAPSCVFVNAIWKGEEVPGMVTEIHLTSSKSFPKVPRQEYIVSADGFGGDTRYSGDFPDVDWTKIMKRYPKARHFRAWGARCNGKYSPTESAPPPNSRKNWPSVSYLRGYRACLTPRHGKVTWPDNALLKSFADDHGAGGKDNKLMAIIPKGGNTIEVLNMKGEVIDTMSTMGLPPHTGEPKGPRYYSKKYAVEIGDIAMKTAGSREVKIRSGKQVFPATDVVLRSGKFR